LKCLRLAVAEGQLEPEHASERKQAVEGEALGARLEFGEPVLTDAEPGRDLGLRQAERLAPADEQLGGLFRRVKPGHGVVSMIPINPGYRFSR
jgi:hypothetical protein